MTAAAQIIAGMVKPLRFEDEHGDGVLTSRETGELYRIFPQSDGTFLAPKLPDPSAPDSATLVARLNERHRARIAAALEVDKIVELVEALEKIADMSPKWTEAYSHTVWKTASAALAAFRGAP